MKKILAFIFAVLLMLGVFTSCAETPEPENTPPEEEYDPGVMPRPYDCAEFEGKAVKSLKIEGTDIAEFTIIYPAESEYPAEKTAANELAAYIKKATGAELAVKDDSAEKSAHEILIGHTNHENDVDREGLGEDGFIIRTSDGNLLITGDGKRGTIYGVYEFCEKYLGWRFLMDDIEVIYPAEKIEIASVEDRQIPKMEFRDPHWNFYFTENIAVKRKISSGFVTKVSDAYGGNIDFVGQSCHTFGKFTDTSDTQPCLTDPAVLEAAKKYVRELLATKPDVKMISVSQNDNWNYCQCENCAKVDEEEGSHAGTIIRFVNAVAEDIKDDYPDVMIHTFAYMYSTDPPKTKPADNVLVAYCAISRCTLHAPDDPDCEINSEIMEDLRGWSELTDHLMIWEYHLNIGMLLAQMPYVDSLRTDMKLYADTGLYGVFAQGVFNSEEVGFSGLRAYLLSKAMWNTDISEEEYEAAKVDFLKGYYGDGWKYIEKFLNFYTSFIYDNEKCILCGTDADKIINYAVLKEKAEEIKGWFASAFELAGDDTVLKDHIERCELLFRCYLSDSDYADIVVMYFDATEEEYKASLADWEERTLKLYEDIFAHGVSLIESNSPTVTDERMKKMTPFEWH